MACELAQDDLARRACPSESDVVVARPFNHIGPRQDPTFAVSSFARQIASSKPAGLPEIHVGNSMRRDFTDVRDVVAALRPS